MSLLVDTVKEIMRNDICLKDLTHNYESLVDLLEEMGLKETQQKNTISYTTMKYGFHLHLMGLIPS